MVAGAIRGQGAYRVLTAAAGGKRAGRRRTYRAGNRAEPPGAVRRRVRAALAQRSAGTGSAFSAPCVARRAAPSRTPPAPVPDPVLPAAPAPAPPPAHGARATPGVDRRAEVRPEPSTMTTIVERNIDALVDRRRRQERARGLEERIADAVTRFTGRMTFVCIHLVLFGAWIAVNLGWVPAVPRFDASFTVLAMAASVEAIFLSTFVLISQNRMQAQADRRADLDLQVSLLAEHEVTQLITLVREMARRMGIEQAHDPALDELQQNVRPEQVLETMERRE